MQTLQALLDGPACSEAFSPQYASGSLDHESPPLREPPAPPCPQMASPPMPACPYHPPTLHQALAIYAWRHTAHAGRTHQQRSNTRPPCPMQSHRPTQVCEAKRVHICCQHVLLAQGCHPRTLGLTDHGILPAGHYTDIPGCADTAHETLLLPARQAHRRAADAHQPRQAQDWR